MENLKILQFAGLKLIISVIYHDLAEEYVVDVDDVRDNTGNGRYFVGKSIEDAYLFIMDYVGFKEVPVE